MASSRNAKQPPGAGMFDPASKLQSNTLKVFWSNKLFINLKCLQFYKQTVYFMYSASLFLSVKNSYTCSLYSCILIDTVPSYCTFCTPGNSVFWILAKIMLCVFDNYERVVLIVYANVDLFNGFVQLFAISWNKLSPEKKNVNLIYKLLR